MIQPADVLVENSNACFIRNGFLIYCTILESNQNYMLACPACRRQRMLVQCTNIYKKDLNI